MKHKESDAKRKVHSTKYLYKQIRESHTTDLETHLKALEGKEANSPRRSRVHK